MSAIVRLTFREIKNIEGKEEGRERREVVGSERGGGGSIIDSSSRLSLASRSSENQHESF